MSSKYFQLQKSRLEALTPQVAFSAEDLLQVMQLKKRDAALFVEKLILSRRSCFPFLLLLSLLQNVSLRLKKTSLQLKCAFAATNVCSQTLWTVAANARDTRKFTFTDAQISWEVIVFSRFVKGSASVWTICSTRWITRDHGLTSNRNCQMQNVNVE